MAVGALVIDLGLTRALTIGGYLIVVAVAVVLEVAARRRLGDIAPLSDTVDSVMRDRTIRVALVVTWWWLGWHFLADPTLSAGA